MSASRFSSSFIITASIRLIGGLSNVTRHSDGVDLSRLKRVYAMGAARFEGQLLMLFSFEVRRRRLQVVLELGRLQDSKTELGSQPPANLLDRSVHLGHTAGT